MLYLNKEDSKTLFEVNLLLYDLHQAGKLTEDQETILARFYRLRMDSEIYSNQHRIKSKKLVQEKRKVDKTYAHSRKTK